MSRFDNIYDYCPSTPAAADEFNLVPPPITLPQTSPFQNLATELVVQVFRFCRFDTPVADTSGSPVPQPLLTLSRVCQRWHNIVFSSPELWKDLYLMLPRDAKYDTGFFGEEDTLLGRSRASPLSLQLKLAQPPFESDRVVDLTVVDSLVKSASRWRNLDLIFGYRSETSPEAQALLSSSPELSRLEVATITSERHCYGSDCLPDSVLDWCVELLASAPHIADLTWDFPTTPLLALPFLHLRRLTLSSINHPSHLQSVFQLLPSVPALESCHIKLGAAINYFDPVSNAEYAAFTHYSLSDLRISCNSTVLVAPAAMIKSWSESVTFPQLKHLSIPRSNLYSPFAAMLTRSSCQLVSLALDMASFVGDGEDITALLSHPSIQRTLDSLDLRTQSDICDPFPTPSVVLKYLGCSGDHCMLPKLASLYLVIADGSNLDDLRSLVTSRQEYLCVDSLRHLHVMGRNAESLADTFSLVKPGETEFEPFPIRSHLRQAEEDYSWYDPFSQDDDGDDYYY